LEEWLAEVHVCGMHLCRTRTMHERCMPMCDPWWMDGSGGVREREREGGRGSAVAVAVAVAVRMERMVQREEPSSGGTNRWSVSLRVSGSATSFGPERNDAPQKAEIPGADCGFSLQGLAACLLPVPGAP
jgi:hypothetical protein